MIEAHSFIVLPAAYAAELKDVMTFTDPDHLEEELDSPRPGSGERRWWAIGIMGCSAMLAVIVWLAVSATSGKVTWQTRSYEVSGDSSVLVTFDVYRPADRAVSCRLKAMNLRFGTVGTIDVTIAAGPERSLTSRGTVRTTEPAVTGLVERCRTL